MKVFLCALVSLIVPPFQVWKTVPWEALLIQLQEYWEDVWRTCQKQTAIPKNSWQHPSSGLQNGWTTPTSMALGTSCQITLLVFSSTMGRIWAFCQTKSKNHYKVNTSLRQFKHETFVSHHQPSYFLFFSFRTVHYYAELGQCSVFSATEAPEQFISQVTVLKYFSHYMEENLMDVSSAPSGSWGVKIH